jgi:ATP-binding cassette subfamily B protein
VEKTRYTDFTLYRKLLQQARPYWPHLAALFLLGLLSIPLALLTPLPLKIAVDSVIGSHPLPGFLERLLPTVAARSQTTLLILAALLAVVIALLDQLQRLGSSLLSTYTGEKLVLNFRGQIFRHVQWLSLTYHDSKGASDSTYRIQYDAPSIRWVLIDGIIPFMTANLTLAGMINVTARIDVQLALVALGILPFLYLVFRTYAPHLRSYWHEVHDRQSSAMSVVQEALAAVRVVKAFGQEDHERDRFIRHASEGMRATVRFSFAEGVFGLLVGLTMAVGTAAVLIIGARNVLAGRLTLGQLLIVMAYLLQLYDRLEAITRMAADLEGSIACAERAFSLLDEAPDVIELPKARPLSRAAGAVAFCNVSFAYTKSHPVLHDICFDVGPGTRVGIAGMTGAGKTTLVGLLNRFYDPTAGQILLDGIDLRVYKLADLRNKFAIVPQEPVLFATTIAENIAYARPGASLRDIAQAAKAANAHEFIMSLPQGYETQVGERGMRLSGGERQRISLARAFLKDAPILILDEPTSSVDVKTEAAILEAMQRLMHGRTTFIIAHRPNALENCNVQLMIENGRLVGLKSLVPTAAGDQVVLGERDAALRGSKANAEVRKP